jgi:hypothetical protein
MFMETLRDSKHKHGEQLEMIEPWLEEADSNPFLHQKSKQFKSKRESPKISRQTSLTLVKGWKSI